MRRFEVLALTLLSLSLGACGENGLPYSHPAYLDKFPGDMTKVDLDLVFLHHSCGQNLLAEGNGGLAKALATQGFKVHTATYGSRVGQDTDVIHWVPKFTTMMKDILETKNQDEKLPANRTNQVVLFKSCYPNNQITGEGLAKIENFKLAYKLLLPIFAKHPEVLFIALTAPPLRREDTRPDHAHRAIEFNQWLVTEWAKGQKNVAAFDFFGILRTPDGYLNYPTRDSHPSPAGNRRATRHFLPFLFKALRRAGLIQ